MYYINNYKKILYMKVLYVASVLQPSDGFTAFGCIHPYVEEIRFLTISLFF